MPQKYNVNQYPVSSILSWVTDGEIAIPEIQRPFVWKSSKVRDLIDSLYRGYPIGYIITWKNPDVRMKDGAKSEGRKILIDGQQRITAMRAAILGLPIVNSEYAEENIHIAFHPVKEEFATLTPAIERDPEWIADISHMMMRESGLFEEVELYCQTNEGVNKRDVEKSIEKLRNIKSILIGYIELDATLDIDTVTDIFIRINSQGVVLSQADFAMSKIASYGQFGVDLRKCIDYFCHLAKEPHFFKHVSENDHEFSNTEYLQKIAWLKDENDDLYDPNYTDVIRVAFTKSFERGKLSDLVSLLSGRNFETRSYEQGIMENSFENLKKGVLEYVNESNFKRFLMIIKSAGFITPDLITSQNAINFAYILYLKLKELGLSSGEIEKYVRRWFVMSMLTNRYAGSPESTFDFDIKNITKEGIESVLRVIQDAELSDTFWEIGLVQELEKSTSNNSFIKTFFAAQVKNNDEGFLSRDITVSNMVALRGDIHHIFPKNYLKNNQYSRGDYNQIANFVYAQTEINIKVGDKAPEKYLGEVLDQCKGGKMKYGNINSEKILKENLRKHCIPESIFKMSAENYSDFLQERRRLMAIKIKEYYKSL